jgi:hypothetical protein
MLVSGFSRAAWISALCHKTFCGNADIRCTAVVVEAVNRETRLSIESNADPLQTEIGRDVCSSAVGARLASVAHTRAISRIFFGSIAIVKSLRSIKGKATTEDGEAVAAFNASSIKRRFARLVNESCDASRLNSCSRILSVTWRTTSRRSSRDLRMTKATIQSARRAVRNIASASDILPCGSDNSATKLKRSHSNARSIVTIMAIASRNPSCKLDHGCLAIVPGP